MRLFQLKFISVFLAALLLLSACKSGDENTAMESADRKINNLVLITIDTVRADTFFAADEHQFNDRLSPWLEKARVYRQAQSVSPWTIPSVATVLTGYYPNQHGAGKFPTAITNLDVQTPSAILTNVTTLAERLDEAGFDTQAASAHPWFSLNFGLQRGFNKIHKRKSVKIDPWMNTHIQQWKSKPEQARFTYLHYMEAHEMHMKKGDDFRLLFDSFSSQQVQLATDWTTLDDCQKGFNNRICRQYISYTQAVLKLRDSIANTLEILEKEGQLENTLVVVYSDHGEEFRDHYHEALEDNHDPRGYAGFGHGNSMYQELLRVPVLVWNPNDSSGRIVDNPISLIDIAPSILDWLGIDTGTDTLPGLLLDDAEQLTERAVFASNMAYGPEQVAVRDGDNKSIWNTVSDENRYFNLKLDPFEKAPLQADELVFQFDQLTGDYMDMASIRIGLAPAITEEQLQHLKAIGYLQGSEADNTAETATSENSENLNLSEVNKSDSDDDTEATDDEN